MPLVTIDVIADVFTPQQKAGEGFWRNFGKGARFVDRWRMTPRAICVW